MSYVNYGKIQDKFKVNSIQKQTNKKDATT
ncbi:hypothetical protein JOD45_001041 [Scopulibacillus daqui]|uniref:Uncharacterized protein n=1 Tax=Scopulibacillus daqui TaxID=1469162 RepID=A0ABS2PXQ7_9BACL|nr:hypothetical protein [Scopulibacillus daqui]